MGEVIAMVGDQRLVSYPELALHNFYADPSGNAVIMEAGETANVLTQIDGPFMVMTNFQNGDFQDAAPSDLYGDGAGRYRTAHAAISSYLDSSDTFDVEQAFDVLQRAATPTGTYKTRYSLVLDPESLEIHIALERDYDHIWKVSLVDRTIETYAGFAQNTVLPLGDDGITGPTLQVYATSAMSDSVQVDDRTPALPLVEWSGIIALALILCLAVVCLLR